MSDDLKRVFDGVIGTLNESVLPNLTDEYARGQVFASIYLLSELKIRTDWAAGWLRDHLAIHLAAFDAVRDTGAPAAPFAAAPDDLPVARLAAMRDEADAWLCAVQRWIDAAPEGPARATVEQAIGRAIKAQAALDVALTPKPMYTKVAKG
ncbi:MAG: hypothetical protein AB7E60_03925 [Sphingobium sp.]